MPSAFISYAHEDQEYMLTLVGQLQEQGHAIRYDQVVLQVGDSVIQKLAAEIADGDFLIAIVSPDSVVSSWCQRELSLAETDGIDQKRVKVLPVRYREAEMPLTLRDIYWADADRDNVETIARKLTAAMRANLDGREADAAREADDVGALGGVPPPHPEAAGDIGVAQIDGVAEQAWKVFDAWAEVEAGVGNVRDLGSPQRQARWAIELLPERVQQALPLTKLLVESAWNAFFSGASISATEKLIREELLAVRTRVAQGLPVTRRWYVVTGGEPANAGNRDASAFRWVIQRGDEQRTIVVFISGTALAVDYARLPQEVVAAKHTNGRSVMSMLVGLDDPPGQVLVTTAGISLTLPD